MGQRSEADAYEPFLRANPGPALELGCGTGLPMLELCRRGYEVDGVDSSADMLARCRERAAELGLEVELHQQEMQRLELPRRYGAIYLAGATLTVLESDAAAEETLRRMHAHLRPGGGVLIPLEILDPETERRALGHFKEKALPDGSRIRVGLVDLDVDPAARKLCRRLRYERTLADGAAETLERDFWTIWWEPAHFRRMLEAAGFETIKALLPDGGPADDDSREFVFLARRAS
ncbi:MAG: class I SAM-dependent methyltransferase [Myxococcota bacterium]|nr:class I SAM-dependent methyltransferase [Myxococcota bacterium]